MRFFLFSFVLTSCLSSPHFQGARTLSENCSSFYGGIGPSGIHFDGANKDVEVAQLQKNFQSFFSPSFFVGGRYGVLSDMDVGVEFSVPGRFSVDGKYTAWASGPYAFGLGLGTGFMQWNVKETRTTVSHILLPLYANYDISSSIGVFTGIRYQHEFMNTTDASDSESVQRNQISSIIYSLGSHFRSIYGEIQISDPLRASYPLWNFAIGINFDGGLYDL